MYIVLYWLHEGITHPIICTLATLLPLCEVLIISGVKDNYLWCKIDGVIVSPPEAYNMIYKIAFT